MVVVLGSMAAARAPWLWWWVVVVVGVAVAEAASGGGGGGDGEGKALMGVKAGFRNAANALVDWDGGADHCAWRGVTCDNASFAVLALYVLLPAKLGVLSWADMARGGAGGCVLVLAIFSCGGCWFFLFFSFSSVHSVVHVIFLSCRARSGILIRRSK